MSERIHATTVAIAGHGVMIIGPSGSGKSDLALRLIDRGAMLISDDYTECETQGGVLTARPPASIAGKIEVRGLGIRAISYTATAPVLLVVRLDRPVDRMPEQRTCRIAGSEVAEMTLAGFEASAPIKVEMAVAGLVEQRR